MATVGTSKPGVISPAAMASAPAAATAVAPPEIDFLIELADALNSTLELDGLLQRVAALVRRVIDYEIFAILLLNERKQEMRMRFHIGHAPEVAERLRVPVGRGITGQAAQRRQAVRVDDVTRESNYINAHPAVRSELAVPLIAKDRVIGVIDIQSSSVGYFTEEHERLLTLVASRVAVAVENARLYSRLARQAETLRVLNEISREFTSILDLDQLFQRIGELLTRLIDYRMFSILLLDESGSRLQHRFALRFNESIQLKHDISLGSGLVGYAAQHGKPVLAPDVSQDPRYIAVNPETRSELCVPLIYKKKVIGVLDLEHTRRGYFTEEHVRTLSTLAGQIAIAIENATLYQRIAREENRLERDLAMAREVQMNLLPATCPALENAQVAARFVPAQAIGGDLYDFLGYSGPLVGIAVGDVSGKGVPAALYAALAAGFLRSTGELEPFPADMLRILNLSLHERSLDAHFVTLIYAVWDDVDRVMRVANSGLPQPVHCHQGKLQALESTGLPLALFQKAEYDEVTVQASAGDVFVFFSDGLSDAVDASGEAFGRNRLEEVIAASCGRSAEEIVDAIFRAVDQHSGGATPFDDQTALVLKVKDTTAVP